MAAKIIDDFGHGVTDSLRSLFIKKTALRISLRQAQPFEQNVVIKGSKRLFSQKCSSLLCRLDRIAGEHSLIDQFGRLQWGLIAEHDVEKFQLIHMTT